MACVIVLFSVGSIPWYTNYFNYCICGRLSVWGYSLCIKMFCLVADFIFLTVFNPLGVMGVLQPNYGRLLF